MERAMEILRELRERDADYGWLSANRDRLDANTYSELMIKVNRDRANLKKDLEEQVKSVQRSVALARGKGIR